MRLLFVTRSVVDTLGDVADAVADPDAELLFPVPELPPAPEAAAPEFELADDMSAETATTMAERTDCPYSSTLYFRVRHQRRNTSQRTTVAETVCRWTLD